MANACYGKESRQVLRGPVVFRIFPASLLKKKHDCPREARFVTASVRRRAKQCDSKANASCYFVAAM